MLPAAALDAYYPAPARDGRGRALGRPRDRRRELAVPPGRAGRLWLARRLETAPARRRPARPQAPDPPGASSTGGEAAAALTAAAVGAAARPTPGAGCCARRCSAASARSGWPPAAVRGRDRSATPPPWGSATPPRRHAPPRRPRLGWPRPGRSPARRTATRSPPPSGTPPQPRRCGSSRPRRSPPGTGSARSGTGGFPAWSRRWPRSTFAIEEQERADAARLRLAAGTASPASPAG